MGAQGEYRGGVRETRKGKVPGKWGFSKGERRGRNYMTLSNIALIIKKEAETATRR